MFDRLLETTNAAHRMTEAGPSGMTPVREAIMGLSDQQVDAILSQVGMPRDPAVPVSRVKEDLWGFVQRGTIKASVLMQAIEANPPGANLPESDESIQDMWYTSSSGKIELKLSHADVWGVPQSGPADDAIAELLTHPDIAEQLAKIDPKVLAAELREYGAWDDEELSDVEQNKARLLWIAVGDIRENDWKSERQAQGLAED